MNYNSIARTNYFHVTDEEQFARLTHGLSAENITIVTDDNDPSMRAFLIDGTATYYRPASHFPDVMQQEAENGLYDEDGNKIPSEEIDSHDNLYDESGCEVFDRYNRDGDWDVFLEEIVKILPDNECFVCMEVGHEGFRYLSGYAVVASKNGIKHMNMSEMVNSTVRELLDDPTAETRYTY